MLAKLVNGNETHGLTFGNGEKRNDDNAVSMRTTCSVVDVAYRRVQRIVLVLPCGDGYSGLVAPQDDGHEGRAVSSRVLRDDVLEGF